MHSKKTCYEFRLRKEKEEMNKMWLLVRWQRIDTHFWETLDHDPAPRWDQCVPYRSVFYSVVDSWHFWHGSGSVPLTDWLHCLSVIFKMLKNIYFSTFSYYTFWRYIYISLGLKDKKLKRCHKTVEIKVFLTLSLYTGMIRTRKNKDETYRSRSTTLQYTVLYVGQRSNTKIQKQVYIH